MELYTNNIFNGREYVIEAISQILLEVGFSSFSRDNDYGHGRVIDLRQIVYSLLSLTGVLEIV